MVFGLIGYPLSHSFSPQYFSEKFYREGLDNVEYLLFPLKKITEFERLKTKPDLKGLNVTIPYKRSVIPYLDELDKPAKQIGAVNTISFFNGQCKGYNTDAFGFRRSLEPLLQPQHKRALILGSGGASRAVAFVLDALNINYHIVSRTPGPGQWSYDQLDKAKLKAHQLIVNCTPLGMEPDKYRYPDIPYSLLGKDHLLYDLVYNPEKTIFLIKGQQQGAEIKNGKEMLYLQAEKSWEIWQSYF